MNENETYLLVENYNKIYICYRNIARSYFVNKTQNVSNPQSLFGQEHYHKPKQTILPSFTMPFSDNKIFPAEKVKTELTKIYPLK